VTRALIVLALVALAACEGADGVRGAYVGGGAGVSRLSN
jgi:hypothetical protein